MSGFNMQRTSRLLSAIILLGLALRVCAVVWIPTVPTEDFWSYFQRAQSLADFRTYDAIVGRPDASYPPGYPLLLSLFFHLPFERLWMAKAINILLSCASIWLVSAVSRLLFDPKTALVAALIAALSPRMILQNCLIASENLFIPLLLLWVLVSLKLLHQPTPLKGFLSGCLLGALTLVRSVANLLALPWLLAFLWSTANRRKFLEVVAALLIGQALVLLPWAVRNQLVLGKPIFLTSTGGANLFIGNNPNAGGSWYPWVADMQAINPTFSEQDVVTQDELAGQAAVQWIARNPAAAAQLYLKKWGLIFKNDTFALDMAIFSRQLSPPWPASDVLTGDHPLKHARDFLEALFNGWYWVFLALGACGLVLAPLRQARDRGPVTFSSHLFVTFCVLYFPAVSAVFLASTRFHWPATDLLIPYAAFLLVQVYETITRPDNAGIGNQTAVGKTSHFATHDS